MPTSVGRPNSRARRSLGLWQRPVTPGSPDTSGSRFARASLDVSSDSVVEASDVASSMACVSVDYVCPRVQKTAGVVLTAACLGQIARRSLQYGAA